jgi:hypothetical protein
MRCEVTLERRYTRFFAAKIFLDILSEHLVLSIVLRGRAKLGT